MGRGMVKTGKQAQSSGKKTIAGHQTVPFPPLFVKTALSFFENLYYWELNYKTKPEILSYAKTNPSHRCCRIMVHRSP